MTTGIRYGFRYTPRGLLPVSTVLVVTSPGARVQHRARGLTNAHALRRAQAWARQHGGA
jgi:hypothetical protein